MPELSSGKFNNLMDRSSRKAGREACKERRSLRTLATRAYYKKAEEIWSIDGGSAAHAAFACSVGPFPTRALKSTSAGIMAVVAHCSATTIMMHAHANGVGRIVRVPRFHAVECWVSEIYKCRYDWYTVLLLWSTVVFMCATGRMATWIRIWTWFHSSSWTMHKS
jgi:hypothetical protein